MGKNFEDLVGEAIGKLSVIKLLDGRPHKYLCLCECGTEIVKSRGYLRDRRRVHKSCGCWRRELNREQMGKLLEKNNVLKWKLTPTAQKLAEQNVQIIDAVLSRYYKEQRHQDTMRSAAHQALCSAAFHWENHPKNGKIAFEAFAYMRIQTVVNRCRVAKPSLVVPSRLRTSHKKINRLRNLFYMRTGRQLQDEQLAKLLDISVLDLQDADTAMREPVDYDLPIKDGESDALKDLIPDTEQLSPLDILEVRDEAEKIFSLPRCQQAKHLGGDTGRTLIQKRKVKRIKERIEKLQLEIEADAGCVSIGN